MPETYETRHAEFFGYLDHGTPDHAGLIHWRGMPVGSERTDHIPDAVRHPGRVERGDKPKVSRSVLWELRRRKRRAGLSWRELAGEGKGYHPDRISAWMAGSGWIPPGVMEALCEALDYAPTPAQWRKWRGETGTGAAKGEGDA